MNGGDKILNRIKSDCDEKIKEIEIQASEKCDEILAEAKGQAEKISAQIAEQAKKKIAQINATSKSRAELEVRNTLLKKRRSEIDRTVDGILDYLLNLSDSDYFEFIYKLASQLDGMSGVIAMNSKDKSRLPKDFTDRLAEAGLKAEVSDDTVDIVGGFILKHGDIEENMGFGALIDAKRDELEDYINRELFSE
ncbi:MAG: V-type ATP synthase subunit E [Ruminococcus sp.]|nr:V-type ATP synthase subunit E [Ruminococcus sp.]